MVAKKKVVKKKVVKKKSAAPGAGLKKYASFLKNFPAVKRSETKITELERKLKAEKKVKAAAVKVARKKYSSTH